MVGLFSRSKPKIKILTTKKDGYSGWIKCTHCHELIHATELEKNLHCCPKCNHHYRLSALQRIELLVDKGSFDEWFEDIFPTDPLSFVDSEKYQDRIAAAQKKSDRTEAVAVGACTLKGQKVALGVLDFTFMAGSMGSVVGEKLTLLIEKAIEERLPLVIVSSSGGARMQESVLSLMQMAKTSAALAKLHEHGLPYISILTNPTTGGVTASFASLGDVIMAEPDALIAFAGPRVVEQTIGQKLPEGAQKSEFLLDRGMIDCIVNRHELRDRVALLLKFFLSNERPYDRDQALYLERSKQAKGLSQKLKELLNASQRV